MTKKSDQNHVQHECLVALTKDEVMERAYELVDVLEDYSVREVKFKSESKVVRVGLKNLRIRIDELGEVVRTKKEYREVDCYEVSDFDKEVVEVFRVDTDERVHARQLTPADRQQEI